MDLLASAARPLPVSEIVEQADRYLSEFSCPRLFDESTVRKKLKKYVSEGILITEKHGKMLYYKRAEEIAPYDSDTLDFFSEAAPCGVIGSFLLDKEERHGERFAFKHHYIIGAMDSEIVCQLFMAMREKRAVLLETSNKKKDCVFEKCVIPLRIMISVQSGRWHLMAYSSKSNRITSFRTDNIVSVKTGEVCERFDLTGLRCYRSLRDAKRLERSLGTLSSGNHFIEIDKASDGTYYLVIHSGSRNLGKQVAELYQQLAVDLHMGKEDYFRQREEIIRTYKEPGRRTEIQDALKELKRDFEVQALLVPEDICWLYGSFFGGLSS